MRIGLVFHGRVGFELQNFANLLSDLRFQFSITSPYRNGVTFGSGAYNNTDYFRLVPEFSNAGKHELLPESRQVGAMTLQTQGPATAVTEALPRRTRFIAEKMIIAIIVQISRSLEI